MIVILIHIIEKLFKMDKIKCKLVTKINYN
jgi:hypothetical protein